MPGRLATQVASRPSSRSRSLAAPLPVGEPRQASHPHHPLSPCHLPPQPHHDYPLWRAAQPSIAPSARNRCFLPAGFRRANRRAARRGGCAAPLGAIDLLSRPRCTGTTTPQPVSLALPPRAWYNERVMKGGRIRPDTLTRESAAAPCRQSKTRCGRHPAFLKNRPETCVPAVRSALFPPTKGEEQPTSPAKHEYRFCTHRKRHAFVAQLSPSACGTAFCNHRKCHVSVAWRINVECVLEFCNHRKCHASVA